MTTAVQTAPSNLPVDLRSESTISLTQAAKMLPDGRVGKPVNLSTVLRWVTKGIKVPGSGAVVRLEGIRMGGRWITSVEALERFAARTTPDLNAEPAKLSRTPAARQRGNDRAKRELAAARF